MKLIDTSLKEKSANRSLERALRLLIIMEELMRPAGLTELSLAAGLPISTVQRLLSVLEKYGFLEKRHGRYQVGTTVLPLAHAFLLGNDLPRIGLQVLQELATISNETASLFVRQDFYRVLVLRVEGNNPLRYVLPIGQLLPLHLGASGKVLAAALPNSKLQQMLDQLSDLRIDTGKPINKETFLAQVDQIRRQGYAISMNERIMGVASVSAPIVDVSGSTIAAVTVAGSIDNLTTKKLNRLSIEVKNAAKAIADRYVILSDKKKSDKYGCFSR